MSQRELSEGEKKILGLIQTHYGPQNVESDVTFTEESEALFYVRGADQLRLLAVNLTNLAEWRDDGSISSDEELLRDWLRVQET